MAPALPVAAQTPSPGEALGLPPKADGAADGGVAGWCAREDVQLTSVFKDTFLAISQELRQMTAPASAHIAEFRAKCMG